MLQSKLQNLRTLCQSRRKTRKLKIYLETPGGTQKGTMHSLRNVELIGTDPVNLIDLGDLPEAC